MSAPRQQPSEAPAAGDGSRRSAPWFVRSRNHVNRWRTRNEASELAVQPVHYVAITLLWLLSEASFAQSGSTGTSVEEAKRGSVAIELNKLEAAGQACRGYFVVRNNMQEPVSDLRLDVFLFDTKGVIRRRVGLTFTMLPVARTKVVLFDLAEGGCGEIGRLLVNEVLSCSGPTGSPVNGCTEAVSVST